MNRMMIALSALALIAAPARAEDAAFGGEARFRELYKELVETNTTLSAGDCTLAAERMKARLQSAGFPDKDLVIFTGDGKPKEGGLVAVLPGTNKNAKAVLLLAHIDVVEAKREDWTRDPFVMVEENGYFYARGVSDDKAMAAIFVDALIRFKDEGFAPKRTIKLALTCGEETSGAFNGAEWLVKNKRKLIDAAFALNEGGGGRLDETGKPVFHGIQVGEKFPQNYTLEVTNPGGHSSRPTPDNAIYRLAAGLGKISQYAFPIEFSQTTRAFFTEMATIKGGEMGEAMRALVKNPKDAAAAALLTKDVNYNAVLHTTCVATMLDAGHATNALPQRARANINCRIFPGTSPETVRQTLEGVVADPAIKITLRDVRSEVAPPPPLNAKVIGPAQALAADMWPGVPNLLTMSAGATDAAFMTAAGIPTYGISGIFSDPDGQGVHGLNERIRVKSVMEGRAYLYRLIKRYTE